MVFIKSCKKNIVQKILNFFLYFLIIVFMCSCNLKCSSSKSNPALEKAAQDFLGGVNTAPSVVVQNGQAAVFRIEEGYLFMTFNRIDVFNGSYVVLFSESGNFKNDSEEILREDYEDGPPSLKIMNHLIQITGASRTWSKVQLFAYDESPIAIAKFDGTDANDLNVDDLEFEENRPIDENTSEEFFTEIEKELKR